MKMLIELDSTKSTGNNGISPKMLKCTLVSLVRFVTYSTCRSPLVPFIRLEGWPNYSNAEGDRQFSTIWLQIYVLLVVSKIIELHVKDIVKLFLKSTPPSLVDNGA